MANDPLKPKDNGKIGLPKIGPGMNKLPPIPKKGGKGAKNDNITLGADDKKGQKADDEKLLARIRKRFERCISAEAENRRDGLDDDKFYAGDQWPNVIQQNRKLDQRPCLTINKLPTFVHQITNDQRQNRPAINVSPVGDKSDPEVAKMYMGLIRAIQRACHADEAYDEAFESAVRKGWGWFRMRTKFEKADSFDQVLVIEPITNAFTVYADPDDQSATGRDLNYGFVTEMIPRNEFEEEYPDAQPMAWELQGTGDSMKNWMTPDSIRVAEYMEIKNERRTLVYLSTGHTGWKDELDEKVLKDIAAGKIEIERERESPCPKVKWYKVTALEVLERKDWVGKSIPLYKVIGDRINIEGKLKLSGIIRNSKDPQRMYNYWSTAETELVALAPKAPWVMEEGQIEGHEDEWQTANTRSTPVLQYKGTSLAGTQVPPPQRQSFAQIPAGVVNAKQAAAQDMMATTGIRFDATLQERTVDESGRALRELQRKGDVGSFHFFDNLCRTLARLGEDFVYCIPRTYDTERVLTILREDDSEERVKIDPNQQKPMTEQRNPQTGKVLKIYNHTYGEYGVTVTIGPSYATKRIEASESMMAFATALPETAKWVADLIAKNQDWPGSTEWASRLAKVLAMQAPQLMQPDMKDVPPEVAALMSGMDMKIKELTMQLQQAMKALNDKSADRAVDVSKIEHDFEAKVLKIVADTNKAAAQVHQQAIDTVVTHSHAMADLGIKVHDLIHKIESGTRQQDHVEAEAAKPEPQAA